MNESEFIPSPFILPRFIMQYESHVQMHAEHA